MFEKEAEERITGQFGTSGEYVTRQRIWQDGAEFGYNKAKEEMQEQGLALQSDMDKTIEQNIQLKAQIEKMKCCENCSFSYCKTSSEHIDKDGNIIFHCWNIEKRTYCDVGKNGKYQCWQLRR